MTTRSILRSLILIIIGGGLAWGGLWFLNKKPSTQTVPTPEPTTNIDVSRLNLDTNFKINQVAANAFGNLALTTANAPVGAEADAALGAGSKTMSSTSAIAPSSPTASKVAYGMGGGGIAQSDSARMMPPIRQTTYEFVYSGELKLPEAKLPVYKRSIKAGSGELFKALQNVDFGLMDIKRLSNPVVYNINFLDQGRNYYINLDLQNDMLSAYLDYATVAVMPEPQTEMKESDLPTDSSLITVARQFLDSYGINLSGYGQPVVDKSWQLYQTADQNGKMYIPYYLDVVFPTQLNGQNIYDESGNLYGPRVNVNAQTMQVTGLWGVTSNSFDSSDYDSEQDTAAILAWAKKGGQGFYQWGEEGKKDTVELGEPSLSYVLFYRYNEQTRLTDQLLIPCYLFPITKKPADGNLYRQNIIVPLIKGLLNQEEPRPIPLMEKR